MGVARRNWPETGGGPSKRHRTYGIQGDSCLPRNISATCSTAAKDTVTDEVTVDERSARNASRPTGDVRR